MSSCIIQWEIFDTEQSLLDACYLCKKIARLSKENIRSFPLEGSECAEVPEENVYCMFIENVTKAVQKIYNNTENPPKNPCSAIGPCVERTSQKRNGTHCYPCRILSAHLMPFSPEERELYLSNICSSSRVTFADFCSLLDEGRKWTFLNGIKNVKKPNDVCDSIGLCHPYGYESPHRKLGNIIFKNRDEL
ncbi:hypothetical protein GPJ56_004706 [Histomonas meleagridis]|uniref:uncharacterized protein n=1 Tax=Histomonas meleagridis TaxID=135588 RepID=UPI00355AAF4B|nr:hypothetical protein GPJ56_004706 [Histomonas meleagridis]KAH0799551.1 hypothetical protein GO595_007619 [Histomonas meleagridis]